MDVCIYRSKQLSVWSLVMALVSKVFCITSEILKNHLEKIIFIRHCGKIALGVGIKPFDPQNRQL